MHDIVIDQFELHLSGDASEAFYAHLAVCDACRTEVAELEGLSLAVREMRPVMEDVMPPLGFYNRLAGRIAGEQRPVWGLFSPGVVFFRRVAFASLLVLAGLGSFLITREASEGGTDLASIMAQHDVSAQHDASADRDRLLVTLASYR